MIRMLIVLFLACLALLFAALLYLPTWGFLLAVVGVFALMVLALKLVSNRIMTSLFFIPFRAKGAVLKNATVEVHAIETVDPPADLLIGDQHTNGQPLSPRDYYRIDVTIKPSRSLGPFKLWEPDELQLIPINAKVKPTGDDPSCAELAGLEIEQDGQFGPDDSGKYFGPQRLRLIVGVDPEMTGRLKFRYYFETFGNLNLPRSQDASSGQRAV